MSSPVVYVVDDDDDCRRALGSLLTAIGVAVRTFSSPGEFLEQLPHDSWGCLITDLRMPRTSGVDLIRRLRAIDSELPVILISGVFHGKDAAEAEELGAVAVLSKPFGAAQLKESLDRAFQMLEQRRAASH
ncbi:MAG: response regulator [Pirellulales bacterium]|nr:response regulator [Pirellulales bacterium]